MIKQTAKIFSLIALLFCLTSTVSMAQKIAHIDADIIVPNMPEYKRAKSEVEAYGKQLQKQLKKEEEKVVAYYQDIMKKAQNGELTPKQEQEAQAKLQQMQAELQKKLAQADQELAKKEAELTKPIYTKLEKAIQDVAKESGYAYILDKKLLLYSAGGNDATGKVKAKLGL